MSIPQKTLYLCYFGLREPLVQTQVLPYLRELVKAGLKVYLLTFEAQKLNTVQAVELRESLLNEGIAWDFLPYHKKPAVLATVYDIFCGAVFAWKTARKEKIDVFHGRVHIPTMMGWIANKFLRRKPKLLFDIRGFFPEEYADAGIWKHGGAVFKFVKYAEKLLLRDADGFVTLTEKGREILFPESKKSGFDKKNRPVEVIPCCVDLNKFSVVNEELRRKMRGELNVENRRVIVYVGSFGGFYMTRETADFFGTARQQDENAFALILTQTPIEMVKPLLEEKGYTEKDFLIKKVSPTEIPNYLSAADIAVSFIKPCYSKLSSSPTKNAEYLAAGLPMIANSGVGDTAEFTREDAVGYIIDEFNEASYLKALAEIDKLRQTTEDLDKRCRQSAEKRFDLKKIGGVRYAKIYAKLFP